MGDLYLSLSFSVYSVYFNKLRAKTVRSVLLAQYCSDDKIEKNDMGGACSAYGREKRRIQDFGEETWGKETAWKTQA